MKMKKFLLSSLVLLMGSMLSVSLTSCGDDDPSKVTVSPSSLLLDSNGGSQSFMVNSNSSWTITGGASWVQVLNMSGNGNQQVAVTVGPNTEVNSRNCMLTITTDDHESSATVTISQDGINPYYLPNTVWEDNHRYDDGSTYVTSLSFSTSTARLTFTYTEGNSTVSDAIDYTYTQPGDGKIVVLNPVEAGKAVMEGRIESGAKMTLTNTSNGSEVAVLYKK